MTTQTYSDILEEILDLTWGPYGFGNPPDGSWRVRNGSLIRIEDMGDEHILNSMRMLELKFPEEYLDWKIYHNLETEIMKRINKNKDWDD